MTSWAEKKDWGPDPIWRTGSVTFAFDLACFILWGVVKKRKRRREKEKKGERK